MNTSRFFLTLAGVLVLVSAPACSKPPVDHGAGATAEPEKEPFGRLSMGELEARMADAKAGKIKLALFDNNPHERFMKGHIPGARWVRFDSVKEGDLPADKDTTLVFYCSNEH